MNDTTSAHWSDYFSQHGNTPCHEAHEFVRTQSTPSKAWKSCTRADWLLWAVEAVDGRPRGGSFLRLAIELTMTVKQMLPAADPNHYARLAFLHEVRRWMADEGNATDLQTTAMAVGQSGLEYYGTNAIRAAKAVHLLAQMFLNINTKHGEWEWFTLQRIAGYAAPAADGTYIADEQANLVRRRIAQPLLPPLQD